MTTLIQAVEQACRESAASTLIKFVTCDAGAVANLGALTPRIAFILQWPEARVRRQLYAMETSGQVLRNQWRRGSPLRWWPVGFMARLRADTSSPIERCQSDRDGDCSHAACPQLRDGEPHKSGRHCPLWVDPSDSYQ